MEQFANITKRNIEDKENENEVPKKRMRHQSQGLSEILEHMTGGNVEQKSTILAKVIDTQDAEVATKVLKHSKKIKETQKLSKEKTAAIISLYHYTIQSYILEDHNTCALHLL